VAVAGPQKTGDLMSDNGWKLIAEAMRRRQEEEAWKALDKKHVNLDEPQIGHRDPAVPVRTNYHRKRTRKS
jgi:hypothetical protein